MKICIDSDEAGRELKGNIISFLEDIGYDFCDLKCKGEYPEVAFNAAKRIQEGIYDRGILICGSGMGMALMANKTDGIYAAVCRDRTDARELAISKGGNIACIGSVRTDTDSARHILAEYLELPLQESPRAKRMKGFAFIP